MRVLSCPVQSKDNDTKRYLMPLAEMLFSSPCAIFGLHPPNGTSLNRLLWSIFSSTLPFIIGFPTAPVKFLLLDHSNLTHDWKTLSLSISTIIIYLSTNGCLSTATPHSPTENRHPLNQQDLRIPLKLLFNCPSSCHTSNTSQEVAKEIYQPGLPFRCVFLCRPETRSP